MYKTDLLAALEATLNGEYLDLNLDSDKIKLVEAYKEHIDDCVAGIPKESELELSCLDSISEKYDSLADFIKNNDCKKVEDMLRLIKYDVYRIASAHAEGCNKGLNQSFVNVCRDVQTKSHIARKGMSIGFIVAAAVFLVAAILLIINAACGGFLGDTGEGICGGIGAFAGAWDFVNGCIFSDHESKDNKKKKGIYEAAEDAVSKNNPTEYFNTEVEKLSQGKSIENFYNSIYNVTSFCNCNCGGGKQHNAPKVNTDTAKRDK